MCVWVPGAGMLAYGCVSVDPERVCGLEQVCKYVCARAHV